MAETVKLFNYLQSNTATIMADLPGGTPDHAKVLAAVKAVPDEDESGASIHKDFDHLGSKYITLVSIELGLILDFLSEFSLVK